jgi:DNA-binding MarR family transcriptional regulator
MKATGKPDAALGPALDFLRALWRLDHALARKSRRMNSEIGVTAEQRLILRCVGRSPGISAGQLAELLHLDPGTISAAISRLSTRRLIGRKRDVDDNRRVTLRLTPAGRALDRPTAGTVESAVEAVLAATRPSEVAAARRLLGRLSDALDAGGVLGAAASLPAGRQATCGVVEPPSRPVRRSRRRNSAASTSMRPAHR